MHHHHAKFFKAFLFIYLIFSLYMLSEHNFGTVLGMLGLGLGLLVAILAHSRYGYLTIALLLVHMVIEWSEHGAHLTNYSGGEIALSVTHAILDFVFLYQELRVHATRYWKTLFASISVALIIILATGYVFVSEAKNSTEEHGESSSLVESFVVGGMFGCILSHLFRRKDECGHSHD